MMYIEDIEKLNSAWKGHRKFAEWLVSYKKPETIVELGVDFGYSLFCLANPRIGKVYGIDSFEGDHYTGVHPNAYGTVKKVIEEHKYDNVEVIRGFFDDVVKTWDKPIDILHIDGLHTFHQTWDNYNNWSKFLKPDAVILFHDVVAFTNVRVVYDRIKMPKMMFEHSSGLGVLSNDSDLIAKIEAEKAQYVG